MDSDLSDSLSDFILEILLKEARLRVCPGGFENLFQKSFFQNTSDRWLLSQELTY